MLDAFTRWLVICRLSLVLSSPVSVSSNLSSYFVHYLLFSTEKPKIKLIEENIILILWSLFRYSQLIVANSFFWFYLCIPCFRLLIMKWVDLSRWDLKYKKRAIYSTNQSLLAARKKTLTILLAEGTNTLFAAINTNEKVNGCSSHQKMYILTREFGTNKICFANKTISSENCKSAFNVDWTTITLASNRVSNHAICDGDTQSVWNWKSYSR